MLSLPLQNYNDATDPGELRPGLEAEQVSPGDTLDVLVAAGRITATTGHTHPLTTIPEDRA